MRKINKDLNTFIETEDTIIKAKVEGIKVISHPGEKGRSVEYEIMQLIRSFLPAEYGLSTGFIAYHDNDYEIVESEKKKIYESRGPVPISSQLDIIIYDALRSGPIIKLGACDVFPLEAVYGYIECKLSATSTVLKQCLLQSNILRKMQTRIYRKSTGSNEGKIDPKKSIPIRSYVFVMQTRSKKEPEDIKQSLEKCLQTGGKNTEETLVTIYIHDKGLYRQKERTFDFIEKEKALLHFKTALLEDLARFSRIPNDSTPAIDTYFMKIGDTQDVCYHASSAPSAGPIPDSNEPWVIKLNN